MSEERNEGETETQKENEGNEISSEGNGDVKIERSETCKRYWEKDENFEQMAMTPITLYRSDSIFRFGRIIATNDQLLCYALRGGNMRIVNKFTANSVLLRGHKKNCTDVLLLDTKEGVLLVTASEGNDLIVTQISEGQEGSRKGLNTVHRAALKFSVEDIHVKRMAFSNTNQLKLFCLTSNNVVYLIDLGIYLKERKAMETLKFEEFREREGITKILDIGSDIEVNDMVFMNDLFAFAIADGRVRLYSSKEEKVKRLFDWKAVISQPVCSVRFCTPNSLVIGSERNTVISHWSLDIENRSVEMTDTFQWKCTTKENEKGSVPLHFNLDVVEGGSHVILGNMKDPLIAFLKIGEENEKKKFERLRLYSTLYPIISMVSLVKPINHILMIGIFVVQTDKIQLMHISNRDLSMDEVEMENVSIPNHLQINQDIIVSEQTLKGPLTPQKQEEDVYSEIPNSNVHHSLKGPTSMDDFNENETVDLPEETDGEQETTDENEVDHEVVPKRASQSVDLEEMMEAVQSVQRGEGDDDVQGGENIPEKEGSGETEMEDETNQNEEVVGNWEEEKKPEEAKIDLEVLERQFQQDDDYVSKEVNEIDVDVLPDLSDGKEGNITERRIVEKMEKMIRGLREEFDHDRNERVQREIENQKQLLQVVSKTIITEIPTQVTNLFNKKIQELLPSITELTNLHVNRVVIKNVTKMERDLKRSIQEQFAAQEKSIKKSNQSSQNRSVSQLEQIRGKIENGFRTTKTELKEQITRSLERQMKVVTKECVKAVAKEVGKMSERVNEMVSQGATERRAPFPEKEIIALIKAEKFAEAIEKGLIARNLKKMAWVLQKIDVGRLDKWSKNKITLPQPSILALVQQLSVNMTQDTMLKLSWVHACVMLLDFEDENVKPYLGAVLPAALKTVEGVHENKPCRESHMLLIYLGSILKDID